MGCGLSIVDINLLMPSDTHMCQKTNHHWFRWKFVAWLVPSHYLNQCWNIDNWTIGNKLQWNLNRNSYILIKQNAFKDVIRKMVTILSQPQCVKGGIYHIIMVHNIHWYSLTHVRCGKFKMLMQQGKYLYLIHLPRNISRHFIHIQSIHYVIDFQTVYITVNYSKCQQISLPKTTIRK